MKIVLKKDIKRRLLTSDEVASYINKTNADYTLYHYHNTFKKIISKKVAKYYIDEIDLSKSYVCNKFLGDIVPIERFKKEDLVDFEELQINRVNDILVELAESNILDSNLQVLNLIEDGSYIVIEENNAEKVQKI